MCGVGKVLPNTNTEESHARSGTRGSNLRAESRSRHTTPQIGELQRAEPPEGRSHHSKAQRSPQSVEAGKTNNTSDHK
jgi:hypothetical protein